MSNILVEKNVNLKCKVLNSNLVVLHGTSGNDFIGTVPVCSKLIRMIAACLIIVKYIIKSVLVILFYILFH